MMAAKACWIVIVAGTDNTMAVFIICVSPARRFISKATWNIFCPVSYFEKVELLVELADYADYFMT